MRKWLPFYASSKAPASRGQLTNRGDIISDGGATFHVFGCPLDGGRKATPLNIEGENPCNSVSPFWQAP